MQPTIFKYVDENLINQDFLGKVMEVEKNLDSEFMSVHFHKKTNGLLS